jgi:amino acid transporter
MKRSISNVGLLMTSVSAIMGSGWLFAVYYTSSHAGPASTLAWVIGAFIMIIIAFVFAELCAMIPVTGSSTRIPHYTQGTLTSFVFSWIIWLTYLTLAPIEVQAIIQYLAFYFPVLTNKSGSLTHLGFLVAAVLLFIATALNVYSIRWLIRANAVLTILKLVLPIAIAIVILLFFFSPDKLFHPAKSSFLPNGMQGIFSAIATGGIVFSFNGFKLAAEMAGEARNPKKALPFAIVGSIVISLVVFLVLQFAFLSSITPANVANGWKNLQIHGSTSPFAAIIEQDKLGSLMALVILCAIIAPFASALVYLSSAARSLYGMSDNGYLPLLFKVLNIHGNARYAIFINYLLSLIMFAPLPGWEKMAAFLTSLIALTYTIGPVSCYTLRERLPDRPRPFRLIFGRIWSVTAFFLCTLLVFWSGWSIISKLGIVIVIGLVVFAIYKLFTERGKTLPVDFRASIWLWPYLCGLTLVSYLGGFGGGKELLSNLAASVCLLVLSVFCIYLAAKVSLSTERITANLEQALQARDELEPSSEH